MPPETYELESDAGPIFICGHYIPPFPGSETDPPYNEGLQLEMVWKLRNNIVHHLSFASLAEIFDCIEEFIPSMLEREFLRLRKLAG